MAVNPEDIDNTAATEGWFAPEFDDAPYTLILQYLADNLSLDDTITQITKPINNAFTTANSGNAIRRGEDVAKNQRQYWSEEEAREQWGDPLPENQVPPEVPDAPSTEGQLWELWYAILHAAKRQSWTDDPRDVHGKLASLVAALRRVPDPQFPANPTKALRNDWIWGDKTLWSTLSLLGAASRESWNDSPGCGAGYSPAAVQAWANLNAFTARLTRDNIESYSLYAIWAMRDALEEDEKWAYKMDAFVPAASAWIMIWGKPMYDRTEDMTPSNKNQGNPGQPGDYMIRRTGNEKAEWSRDRWAFWKERFREISVREKVTDETRSISKSTFKRMEEIEKL
jgi:hypothetical protein